MRLFGEINLNGNGICTSLQGMYMQTELLNNINENVIGFNKVGYQRKEAVISSFAEIAGVHALSKTTDKSVGRIRLTGNPLDLSIANEGYFQYLTPQGVKLTRDGRFKIDKDGHLLTQEGFRILSFGGKPMKFNKIPEDLDQVKFNKDGSVSMVDFKTKQTYEVGRLSVVSLDGNVAQDIDIRQGYTEDSNVRLQTEFFRMVPVRRNFEANRQLFITQNDELSKTIQELGRS
ncbi:MAG: flagellar hook-basal body complex protein [bacterium]